MKSIIIIFIAFISISLNSDKDYIAEIQKFQHEMNTEFKDSTTSPLTKKDLAEFTSLDFFKIDKDYRVEADLKLNKAPKKFGMKTTTTRLPIYIKYGVASFKLKGKDLKINIYKNVRLAKMDKYKDYLFMLFTDKTSGETTYGGGRYIDLRISKDGQKLVIDFNKAYNPYCAYNHKYSCPIPPNEDYFDMEINAGVKKWKH